VKRQHTRAHTVRTGSHATRWGVITVKLLITGLLISACADDAGHQGATPLADGADGLADLLDATQPTDGADGADGADSADGDPDAWVDDRPIWPEARAPINPQGALNLTPDTVTTPRADDLACDWDAKTARCASPLLTPTASPSDPSDLLFHVNRAHAIPATYPVSEASTWSPCAGTRPEADNDLVCVPGVYTSGGQRRLGLREVAWESPSPASPLQTWDGKPIGYEGKVGFKAMMDAAAVEAGVTLFIASGYRSHETQRQLHERYAQEEADRGYSVEEGRIVASTYSARPGHSEHQLGTTADVTFQLPDGSTFPGLEQEMGAYDPMRWLAENAHRFGLVMTYERHAVEETQYVWEPWHFRFVGVEVADAMRSCGLNTEHFLRARYQAPPNPPYEGEYLILRSALTVEAHPNLPPGAWVRPGEAVTKRWQVRNTGSVNWRGLSLAQVGGPAAQLVADDVPCVLAGEAVILEAALTAPTAEGLVKLTFALRDPAGDTVEGALVAWLNVSQTQPPPLSYQYVKVQDLSRSSAGSDPGADIDAVVVTRADGSVQTADAVIAYQATPNAVLRADPLAALGQPDAFDMYPDVATCRVDGGFVSLGGEGELILRLEAPLEEGDTVEVLEVGACAYAPDQYAIAERISLAVSPTPDLDGLWVDVTQGVSPVITWTVADLP
jgi:hypothetical protein